MKEHNHRKHIMNDILVVLGVLGILLMITDKLTYGEHPMLAYTTYVILYVFVFKYAVDLCTWVFFRIKEDLSE